jgi:hypothetical protein
MTFCRRIALATLLTLLPACNTWPSRIIDAAPDAGADAPGEDHPDAAADTSDAPDDAPG